MNDLSLEGFQRAIMAIHEAHSRFVKRVPVGEESSGDDVCTGEVLVFDLLDHPRAPRCYVWEEAGVVTLILHDQLVDSPRRAVEFAISEA